MDVAREIAEIAVQQLAAVLRLASEVDAGTLAQCREQVEREIKRRYGGDEVHIRCWRDLPDKAAAVRRDYLAGVSVAPLLQRHGISRRTLYRYLKRA